MTKSVHYFEMRQKCEEEVKKRLGPTARTDPDSYMGKIIDEVIAPYCEVLDTVDAYTENGLDEVDVPTDLKSSED